MNRIHLLAIYLSIIKRQKRVAVSLKEKSEEEYFDQDSSPFLVFFNRELTERTSAHYAVQTIYKLTYKGEK